MNKKNIFIVFVFLISAFVCKCGSSDNLHQVFFVFLFRKIEGKVEILLQKRSSKKAFCPNLWAETCCSRLGKEECLVQEAKKRLNEEMGICIDKLESVGSFVYQRESKNGQTKKSLDHVLIGMFDSADINFNSKEVQAVRWVTLDQLEKELIEKPEVFVPWLAKVFSFIPLRKLLNS